MRGPGYKLSGDVRRTWHCPACGCERKLSGEVTTLLCGCKEGAWMQISGERTMVPRPLQRPSDVERHPIDFGIEPNAPAPARPEATIIKSAISQETELIVETLVLEPSTTPINFNPDTVVTSDETVKVEEEEWGEGIL